MNWNQLTQVAELNTINEESNSQKILVFKHSTRCNISSSALNRLERNWNDTTDSAKLKPYYLDLIAHRDISAEIASKWNIEHESPQVLVIKNGKCIYNNSHLGIDYEELMAL
ncbi:MAG: bacillithiol system redox-active protein YtxJ [Bacteroidota bacterium]